MCRISRHTTLLLSGIASLECRMVKMANQGAGLLFIGAEILANLACCSCSIPWIKPLPIYSKVEDQRIANARERRDAPCRDVVRGHVGKPPYAPYPRRARTPRHRSDHRSLRCASGSSPVPSVESGPRQVASIHRPAHRPWRAIGRRSGARRRPCRDLSTRV
jgi:hypothetical protein